MTQQSHNHRFTFTKMHGCYVLRLFVIWHFLWQFINGGVFLATNIF